MKKKFLHVALFLLPAFLAFLPKASSNVCPYVSVNNGWTGKLSHCYDVSVGEGVVYTRSYCVYTATSGHSGTRTFNKDAVNQC